MNLGVLLANSAKTHPDKVAFVYGDAYETYMQLNKRVNALGNSLRSLGLRKQARVAIIQNNCPQLIESLFACFKAGYTAVPINSRLHPNEFSYILDQSESSAAIFGEEFKEIIHEIKRNALSVEHLICLSNPEEGMLDYEKLIASNRENEISTDAGLDDLAWLFYTSGTTGKPKGAMLTHRNLMVMTTTFFADLYPAAEHDVALHAAPLTHGSGLYTIPLLSKGVTNIILKSKSFDPTLLLATVEQRKVTLLPFLAPTMIKLLLKSPYLPQCDLQTLKCIVYGGSPMYVEDLKEAVEHLGQILVQIYGQGEAPMTISYLGKERHVLNGTEQEIRRLSSAGVARTDVEVKVVDPHDKELAPGEVGEIVVRGDIVMTGYWHNAEATKETLRNRWLHTGDIGCMDEAGFIYILDRQTEMIISGGANIYPRDIEEVMVKHPAIEEVAVFGVPDDIWGEAVKALVVLKQGAETNEEQLIEFCKQHLASYKKPKSLEFVSNIPKNAYGKIAKRELRDRYWQ
ncbi:MAG: long-chain fatty acid--CoA ligase, partial [Candidatus Bathyarchaeia archaeon]